MRQSKKSPHVLALDAPTIETRYQETIASVRPRMTKAEELTSEVVHAPLFERILDFVAGTLARPLAMLLGGICAFAGTITLYAYARFIGLRLSGSETIVFFMFGWLVGTCIDIIRDLFRRKP